MDYLAGDLPRFEGAVGIGGASSATLSTSGPPTAVIRTARIPRPLAQALVLW